MRTTHLPQLDGLRGIAIALVLAYHLDPWRVLPGSWMGVDLFFALSGFLICVRLLDDRGTGRLGRFYARRARRLLPALCALLLVYVAVVPLGARALGEPFPGAGELAIGLVMRVMALGNVAELLHYRAPGLEQLWSLGLEEQFYLLFAPVALWVGARSPRMLAALCAALAGVSLVWAGFLALSEVSTARIYLMGDTRAGVLLAGAACGAWWHTRPQCSPLLLRRLGGLIVVPLAVMGSALLRLDNNAPVVYVVVLPAIAMGAALGVLLAALDAPWLRWLVWSPLRWLGRRSYAVYLWHMPAQWLASRAMPAPLGALTALGAALVLGELSWRLVERRFLV